MTVGSSCGRRFLLWPVSGGLQAGSRNLAWPSTRDPTLYAGRLSLNIIRLPALTLSALTGGQRLVPLNQGAGGHTTVDAFAWQSPIMVTWLATVHDRGSERKSAVRRAPSFIETFLPRRWSMRSCLACYNVFRFQSDHKPLKVTMMALSHPLKLHPESDAKYRRALMYRGCLTCSNASEPAFAAVYKDRTDLIIDSADSVEGNDFLGNEKQGLFWLCTLRAL